jgi:class 3 adenylate cyclase/TolB-like protein/Tfp pilus assembly protein PilF
MPEDRRLAAIMFTDIVGYTALMGSDEDQAFKVLAINREIHSTILSRYKGTIIKEMGDGILASFHSSSEAVRCAVELQQEAKLENIKLRIGIHEGEVVFVGDDVFGDGVNVASRLEEIADEGCINVSGVVYKNIKNKIGITTAFLEERTFKNVDEPVKVYQVQCEESERRIIKKDKSKFSRSKSTYYIVSALILVIVSILIWQFLPNNKKNPSSSTDTLEKTIAVIPFWNDSPDPDNEYFCSGMEEEIRIQLLKISDLLIESRQSVEKYRENSDKDIFAIGKDLDVSYIIEGSVRKIGNDVRITVQLIDTKSGGHLWGDTYDGDYTQKLLIFQSNTAKKIAASLHAIITPEEEKRINEIPTKEITAYDYALRGEHMLSNFWSTSDIKYLYASLNLFNKALENDPDFVRAIIGIGQFFSQRENIDSAFFFAEKALKLNPDIAESNLFMGGLKRSIGEYDEAISSYLKAIELSPNDWWANYIIGTTYIQNKSDIVEGLPYIQKAFELCTEERVGMYLSIGLSYFHIDDFDKAEYYLSKAMELNAGCIIIMRFGWLYHNKGDFQKAIEIEDILCEKMDCNVICDIQRFYTHMYLKNFETANEYYKDAINAGRDSTYNLDLLTISYVLRELGRKEESDRILNTLHVETINQSKNYESAFSNFILASIYAMRNDKEKAIEHLVRYENWGYSVWFNEIKIYPLFENLWEEPEFIALIERIDEEKAKMRSRIRQMEQSGEITF